MTIADTPRTCLRGHGAMVKIHHIDGIRATFSVAALPLEQLDSPPIFLSGLGWYVCMSCGFTELVDEDPQETLRMLETKNEQGV